MPNRLFYPATERNRDPILSVLKNILPEEGHFLEIASGSGEHIVHFAQHFKKSIWQPSDLEEDALLSIQAWCDYLKLKNVKAPLKLDTTTHHNWPEIGLDGILCINMIHISPWEATIGLMKKAGNLLKKDGILYTYGPYKKGGQHTAASNQSFELWLKEKDPRFGVRDLEAVEAEANLNGLALNEIIEMPANNFSLVFHKN